MAQGRELEDRRTQILKPVSHFFSIIYPKFLHVHPTVQLIATFQTTFNYSNLWVSACLCGFYCIKIASFRNSFFIYLKGKIDRMVPWILLGSEILALAMGIVVYDLIETVQWENHTFTSQENFWEARIKMDKHFFSSYFLAGFGYAASFMAVIFSAVFLLFSLWRHKRRMQTNSMKDLSMDAHIRAMKSILSFLTMYSINFVCLILTLIYSMKHQNLVILLGYVIQHAYPGVHSLILIFSNPKLEKTLLRILCCLMRKFCMR
ncbi:LOW QUALITY PROTEIN: taste receptor type 2 member 7-like [Pyrgilauda ruficollis]|uniref:LOW QUALITY PROTEIN: taste receptor type 2 member 7-like n=1 Tax=Pyrgilauda ruficollis TaxID=221976 RepID=UPI001B85F7B6|nr:LOW QUALITY PROTEIN: taste receptor type 2 member 7-like [Pyrgilauda ruficollis]